MLARRNPDEAYRRVALDAAILGSDSQGLARLCFEEFQSALARALYADQNALSDLRRTSLTRANASLSAVRSGLDKASPLAAAFSTLLDAAEDAVRGAMVRFDPAIIARVRRDFADILSAMGRPLENA